MEKLARLAGYRFVLREVTHEKSAPAGDGVEIKMKWDNVGVGRLYRPCRLALALRGENGETMARADGISDSRDWSPGVHEVSAKIQIPFKAKPGNYKMLVAIVDTSNAKPPLRLAIDAPQSGGWYEVSWFEVK